MNDVSANQMPAMVIPKAEKNESPRRMVPLSEVNYTPMDKEQINEVLAQIKNNPDFRLERNPDSDSYGVDPQFNNAQLMAMKAPTPEQVINGLKIMSTVIGLLTEVVRSGRELSDVIVDWFRSNPDKSDKEKATTMKMAFALASQMDPEESAQGRSVS